MLATANAGHGVRAAAEPQTVTVAYNATGDFPEPAATLEAAKASFEAANPGVTVELQQEIASDDDYHTKMQLRLQSGGDVPDVMYYSPNWLDADAAAGYLAPLDEGLAAWPDWEAQFPEAVRAGAASADGHTYGMPMSANDIGIWYNRDVFAVAGLPEDWQPKSWADMREAAETIKANVPDVIPMHLYAGKASGVTDAILKTFQPLLYGTGDVLYDFDTSKWQPAGQGFLDVMSFISAAYADDLTADEADVLSPNVWSFIGPWMQDSHLGFVLDGNWMSFAWIDGGPERVAGMERSAWHRQRAHPERRGARRRDDGAARPSLRAGCRQRLAGPGDAIHPNTSPTSRTRSASPSTPLSWRCAMTSPPIRSTPTARR